MELELRHVSLAELDTFPNTTPDGVRPKSLTIDITHACPFRCPGCIEKKAMRHSRRTSLSCETACRLISQFAEYYGGKEVLLYGGEPTSHPHFPIILRHAARVIPLIRLVTNGALLKKPQIADAICEAAEETQLSVRVSLNAGTPETHEELHRVKGFFNRVVKGMETIRNRSEAVDLSVSFLLEEANASEVLQAYEISTRVGASLFWLRPKTGLHGIGLLPLSSSACEAVLEALWEIEARFESGLGPRLHVEPWFLSFLEHGVPPDTSKPYPACYYCAAARLVITPPEPGIVWSCTYWRADLRFFVADLSKVRFGSDEFERLRIAANRRIVPQRDCGKVICNRSEANKAIWERLQACVVC